MPFTRRGQFSKLIANLPDSPSEGMTSTELKQYWDSSPEEVRVALNNLMTELESTNGASNVGAAAIPGLSGANVQTLLRSIKTYIDAHLQRTDNPHNITAAQLNVYTKDDLAPYLTSNGTIIKYEVFTIQAITAMRDPNDVTVTTHYRISYKSKDGTNLSQNNPTRDVFSFPLYLGSYQPGANRIEGFINDTEHVSSASGGLVEESPTMVRIEKALNVGDEITLKYFENLAVAGGSELVVGTIQPAVTGDTVTWFKVVG